MGDHGRVAVCGGISTYNAESQEEVRGKIVSQPLSINPFTSYANSPYRKCQLKDILIMILKHLRMVPPLQNFNFFGKVVYVVT